MVRKARIAVLVSGGGTNLQALIDAERSGAINAGEISLVLSNKADAYALERARTAGIKTIKEGLKAKGGYCPCRLERTEDNKCICKEFREQIADPNFEGYCHCMLYYKEKQG